MKKYIIVFLITTSIFISAFYISGEISNRRIKQLDTVQEKLSLNILATETRFSLLQQASCENVLEGSNLEIGITQELNSLAQRIKFLENGLDFQNQSLALLRDRYALLQIKDYLLVKELAEKCDYTIATLLYFYDTDCPDCERQSIILDQIRQDYNHVRVYWLDASLVSPAIDTTKRLFNIESYPALVVGEDSYDGFIDYESLSKIIEVWTTENNALIETARPEIVQEGIDFILDGNEELTKELITFVSLVNGVYTYKISETVDGVEQEQEVLLEYNDGFSLIEN